MRKHLFATLLLACGMPLTGNFAAFAAPEPQSQSQSVVTITGTVLDENNEPVIGASVVQKGVQGNAAATDFDGNFTLRVPAGSMLRISYVGYKPVEMAAKQGMMVYMQPTTEQLNELVAIGYGTQKKANLTGAVATVDVARTMDSRPATDVAKALQGAVPGLTITSANGSIEGNPTINIRGVGTLSNSHNSAPLIVVDGVPVEDMSFLNPEDIQDISVLKDASSSAIYGSRAAFGVILVTTKDAGKTDRVSVNYTNNFGWGRATVLPEFSNTVDNLRVAIADTRPGRDQEIFSMYYDEILPFAERWQQQHGGKPYTNMVELHPFQSWDNVGDYWVIPDGATTLPAGPGISTSPLRSSRYISYADWDIAKTLFQSAPTQKHNVSLEGSSGKTQYRLSFGYDAKEGLLKYSPDQLKRYMANASVSTQIFDWWKAGARFSFTDREYVAPNENRNPYQYMWRWPGFWENYGYIYDEEGNPLTFRNTIGIREESHKDKTTTTNTRMQAYMTFNPFKGFTLPTDFTYSLRNQNSDSAGVPYELWDNWAPGAHGIALYQPYTQATSYAAQSNYKDSMWAANVFGTYDVTFNEAHNLKVMLGWSAEQEEYRYFYARRNGLVDDNLPNINLTNSDNYTTSGTHTHRATTGFFGRINYDYKGIYLVELNGRYDGSSRFPAHDQWAFFPSGSLGYRFSEENYFEPLKSWWSNGKLRASYGHIGNEAVGDNMFLSTVSRIANTAATGYTNWVNGNQLVTMYDMPTLVSSTLTWERIVTTDVGIDLGFLDNSINVGFDWYQRDTKDMLGPTSQLPAVLGTGTPYGNAGSLRTNGWELSINWNHSFGDADVYATFNIGDARTKITKWNNPNQLIYTYLPTLGNYTEGQYFGDIWGFETQGFFTMDDFTFVPGSQVVGEDGSITYTRGTYVPNKGVADQSSLQTGDFSYGPGDVRFVDQNGDGKINNGDPDMVDADGKPVAVGSIKNHGDLKVIGNALPRYEYSFRLGGAWKGFDLDLFFQGVGKRNMWATGSTIIPMAQSSLGTFTNLTDNYNQISFNEDNTSPDYGKITNAVISDDNLYARLYSGAGGAGNVGNIGNGCYNYYPQSRYLMNMAYLRLKNLTVGYTLPAEITRKALIQKARIYFSADNLCFLYNGAKKYQLDPEMVSSAGSTAQGYNDGVASFGRTIPMQRIFSFGVQVTL